MYKVEVTPVVGLPQFTGWSHVASSHSRFGHLVCAFAIKGEHAGNVGRDLTELITNFSVNSATDLHDLLAQLQSTAQELDTQLTIAAGFFTNNALIIGALQGSVFLKREQRMGVLLTALNEIKIVEGKRKSGDVIVLGTQQAQTVLPEIEQRFKTGFDVDSVIASIIPGLHSNQDSSLSSLAFVTGGHELEDVAMEEEQPLAIEFDAGEPIAHSRLRDQSTEIPSVEMPTAEELNHSPLSPLETIIEPLPPIEKTPGPTLLTRLKAIPVAEISHRVLTVLKLFFVGLKQIVLMIIRWIETTINRWRSGEVYVGGQSPRKMMRVILPVGIGLAVILGLLAWWLFTTRSQIKAAEATVAPQLERLTTARQTLNTDPLKAREETQAVIGELQRLEQEFAQQKAGQKVVSKHLNEAGTFYESISGVEAVQELEIFYDLRLVDSEFVATQVDAYGDKAVFLDQDRKKAVILSISTKQAQQLSLDQMDKALAVSVDDKAATFLGNGVFQTSLTGDPQVARIIEEGDSNRTATHIETFASYVYVLNPEKRNVYRYTKQTEGFSDPIGWVSGAVQLDFNQVDSWAIDGQVWVSTNDAQLHLLGSGREQTFEVKGLTKPFEHPLTVFTRDGFTNLYVLEANAQRIVILNKDGVFIKEVSSPSLASATGLFVDEASGTAYAVSGSIVYAVKL